MKLNPAKDVLTSKVADIDLDAILDQQSRTARLAPSVPVPEEKNPLRRFSDDAEAVNYYPASKIEAPENAVEIVEKRKATSKTFLLPDGSFHLISDRELVHFEEDGAMMETKLLIQDIGGKKVMLNAAYKCELFTDRVGYRLLQPDGSTFSLELVAIEDTQVDNSTLKADVDRSQVFYNNFLPGVSFKVLLMSDRPRVFTMLADASCPKKFSWKIVQSGQEFSFETAGLDDSGDALDTASDIIPSEDGFFLYVETWSGKVSRVSDKKTRIKALFDDPAYPVIIDPTVTINTAANADDGRSSHGGWIANGNFFGHSSHGIYGGFRFQSVGVPAGATITSAHLKIKVTSSTSGANGAIKGNKVGNAAAWGTGNLPINMTKTTASSAWTPTVGVNSIPITSVVGEIVGLGSWASNNAMKFGAINFSARSKYVFFSDHEHSPANAPQLIINYTTGGGGGGPTGEEYIVQFN